MLNMTTTRASAADGKEIRRGEVMENEPILRLHDLPDILTPAEVCGLLRKDVEKPCKALRALERGGLRVLKVGRDLRVMRVDLEEFLAAIPR